MKPGRRLPKWLGWTVAVIVGLSLVSAGCGKGAGPAEKRKEPAANDAKGTKEVKEEPKTAEELVKALEGLSPQDREKKLIEGAQKEGGAFSFYTSFNADDADAFKNAFVKKYPFIKVTTFRAGSGKVADRIVTEARAGQFLWDVADVSADFTYAIQQVGVLAKYTSPVKEKIDPKLYDPEGYWTGVATEPVAIAWNTNLVKAGEAPRSYEELADPKWKGKFSLDTEDHNWALFILKTRGEKEGKELLTKLAANKPQMIRGRSQQLEMLVAGEFPLTVAMLEHRLVQYTSRGAPVGFAFVRPALVGLEGLYLSKKAPHPYTAVLFMDWILSDGQEMFVSQGRTGVVTKDVKYKYPRQGEGLSGDFIVIPPEDMAKNAEAIAKFFNETFGLTKTKQ